MCNVLNDATRIGEDDDVSPAILRAGVDALNQFDPRDWNEGWVSAPEIVRALYRAMIVHPSETSLARVSEKRSRHVFPASVLAEMSRRRPLTACPLSEVTWRWGSYPASVPKTHEQ